MARWLLIIAGVLTSAITLLHIVIVFVGAPGYRYFGAGEQIAKQAEAGSPFPALLMLFIAAVFTLFSLYEFSGSGVVRPLPLLRVMILGIGAIFILRGLALFPQLMQLSHQGQSLIHRAVVFSGVSLLVGLCYVLGSVLGWQSIPQKRHVALSN